MSDTNKVGFDINSEDEESTSDQSQLVKNYKRDKDSKRGTESPPEHTFPTLISAVVIDQNDSVVLHHENADVPHFSMIVFEEAVKALAMLYLSIGIVASVVNFIRNIDASLADVKHTWIWIGTLKAVLSLSATIMTICYKARLCKMRNYGKYSQPDSSMVYYTCVVIPSTGPLIYNLLVALHHFQYRGNRLILPDYLLPMTDIIFTITVLVTISDVTFYRIIINNLSNRFYVMFKVTITLVTANCFIGLIFNVFDVASQNLRRSFLNMSGHIHRMSDLDGNYVNILIGAAPFLQLLMNVFFLSSIIILVIFVLEIKIPRMVPQQLEEDHSAGHTALDYKYSSTSFVLAILTCILSVIVVPLDFVGKIDYTYLATFQQIFLILPLCMYAVTCFFMARLFQLLLIESPMKYTGCTTTLHSFVIWLSLLGQLTACLKFIINSQQFSTASNNHCNDTTPVSNISMIECKQIHIIAIIFRVGTIVQSMLQSILLAVINNMTRNGAIDQRFFEAITYPIIILISSNFGFLITDWYLLTMFSTFKPFPEKFITISWDFLGALSDPFTLLFKMYSILYLFKFLSNLRSGNADNNHIA